MNTKKISLFIIPLILVAQANLFGMKKMENEDFMGLIKRDKDLNVSSTFYIGFDRGHKKGVNDFISFVKAYKKNQILTNRLSYLTKVTATNVLELVESSNKVKFIEEMKILREKQEEAKKQFSNYSTLTYDHSSKYSICDLKTIYEMMKNHTLSKIILGEKRLFSELTRNCVKIFETIAKEKNILNNVINKWANDDNRSQKFFFEQGINQNDILSLDHKDKKKVIEGVIQYFEKDSKEFSNIAKEATELLKKIHNQT